MTRRTRRIKAKENKNDNSNTNINTTTNTTTNTTNGGAEEKETITGSTTSKHKHKHSKQQKIQNAIRSIGECIHDYENQLSVSLESLGRQLLDIVHNNKIIVSVVNSGKFYNGCNMIGILEKYKEVVRHQHHNHNHGSSHNNSGTSAHGTLVNKNSLKLHDNQDSNHLNKKKNKKEITNSDALAFY